MGLDGVDVAPDALQGHRFQERAAAAGGEQAVDGGDALADGVGFGGAQLGQLQRRHGAAAEAGFAAETAGFI